MNAEIPTPFGPIPAAPADATAPTVLLWVVTILVVILACVCALLWSMVKKQAAKCEAENEAARKEATAARDRIEDLYKAAVEQFATRETRLTQVVEANTAVLSDIREIGSGYYRTLRDQRNQGAPRDPRI